MSEEPVDSQFAREMFGHQRDRFEKAVRLSGWILGALFLSSVAFFAPYVERSRRLETTRVRIADAEKSSAQFGRLSEELKAVEKTIDDDFERELTSAVFRLRASFEALDIQVLRARNPGDRTLEKRLLEADAEREAPPDFDEGRLRVSPIQGIPDSMGVQDAIQAIPNPPSESDFVPSPVLTDSLREELAGVGTMTKVIGILSPFIEENLITPWRDSLQRIWDRKIAPSISARAERASKILSEIESPPGGSSDALTAIEEQVQALLVAATDFKIEVPVAVKSESEPWWSKFEGKVDRSQQLAESARQGLRLGVSEVSLEALSRATREALELETKLRSELESSQERLAADFEKFTESLSSFAQILKFVPYDLPVVSNFFPAILSVAWFVLTIWISVRLRFVSWAAHRVPDRGTSVYLRDWLDLRSPRAAELLAGIGLVWTLLAAMHLSGWEGEIRGVTLLHGALGAFFVGAGYLYHRRTLRDIHLDRTKNPIRE